MNDPGQSTVIRSAANPAVRAALALRERRERMRTGLLLVDGAREVARALDGGIPIRRAFIDGDSPPGVETTAVIGRLVTQGITVVPVGGSARERLAYGDRAGVLVAIAEAPSTDLDRVAGLLAVAADPLVVVVEDVEKPGNLGAIVRTADGAGATAVVAAAGRRPGVDPWNPNAIRASLGTVFTMPLAVASTEDVLACLRSGGFRVVAARLDAATRPWDADLRGPVALAVGSEADGLGTAWAEADIEGVLIPMLGRADSLNVSVATAILLYEARRQRDATGAGEAGRRP
jgi:TrmH family RNA methyltransferase